MTKTEELRNHMAALFEKCTDKETISQLGVINNTIEQIEAETKAKDEEYTSLLKDYKDVVLHSSFKPQSNVDATQGSTEFNPDQFIADFLAKNTK